MHLQRLEEILGSPLFSTSGRRKEPTPFAREFYSRVSISFLELESKLLNAVRVIAVPESLTLRVACRSEALSRVAQRLRFPGGIVLKGRSRIEAFEDLKRGAVDFAIVSQKPDFQGIIAKPCLVDDPMLIFSKGQQLCSLEEVFQKSMSKVSISQALKTKCRDEITTQRWIFYNETAPLAAKFFEWFNIDFKTLSRNVFCEDWRAVCVMVEQGGGVSVIPSSHATDRVNNLCLPQWMCGASELFLAAPKSLLEIPSYKSAWRSLLD
jgi:DNA-binding transcriptional LysR family regulator